MPRVTISPARFRALRIALLAAATLSAPALAEDDGDEPIVVTARRQEENFFDVPLAVDVVKADAIGAGAVDDLQTLAAKIPGLSFEAIWGGANSFPILRGQNQPSVAGDSVGMFVDGVYQANRDAIDVEPLDLVRIEVVKGPQSALFGHSSFAGLIHYIPAQPTETVYLGAVADIGTDNLYGIRGTASGPVSTLFKARVAASWKSAEGTYEDAAEPGRHLGNVERFALAATIATRDGSGPLSARLAARYGDNRSNQPPFFTVDYHQFNCGGRDAASGVWSYYCGKVPVASPVPVSSGLPESRTRTGQVALHLALDLGAAELRSDSNVYRAESDAIRDFDGGESGDLYGVCTSGVNCTGIGSLVIPVTRLQLANIVNRRSLSSREITQELRLQSTGDSRFAWLIGGIAFWNRLHSQLAFGAERGALAGSERFSSLVLANPRRVGSPAAINNALAFDPNASQTVQNEAVDERRTLALFATADYRLREDLRLRGEVRGSWERLVLDSRRSNFAPGFGTSLGARNFHDITPRFSLDWQPAKGWLVFASYARGSRSGGINPVPNLLPEEQTYAPETNWTTEIGMKYAGSGLFRSIYATAYDIDWRNTQILGLSITPGITALITRNTQGVHTQGIEIGAELAPARWLSLDFTYSHTDPRFKTGSEDPGSNAFCGLSATNVVSSFCTIRQSSINPGQLVPNISGNRLLRAAKTSWTGGITIAPLAQALRGARLWVGISYQGNVYERAINGLYYGERTLVDARLTVPLGSFSLELWGTNLADESYVRSAAGRQPQFYIGIPRPTDLILGEGRRIGLTLRISR